MQLDVDMRNVGVARRFVGSTLGGLAPDPVIADLTLAMSELVTNAFEHGLAHPVTITARSNPDGASISVRSSDTAGLDENVDAWALTPETAAAGRGLGIVRAVADHIDVSRVDDTLEVTVHRVLTGDSSAR